MRRGWLALPLLAAGCTPLPQWYAPPAQRGSTAATELRGPSDYITMADPMIADYLVSDIADHAEMSAWRWTRQNPTLKFHVAETANRRLEIQFAIADVTFAETGPVSLRALVNGAEVGRAGPLKAGKHSLRWPVPAALLKPDASNTVRFEFDKVYIAPADQAKLGVILESAGFVK